MYLDYIVKKLAEIFVKNVLIFGAIFFGEKFIIEFVSKKSFERVVNAAVTWLVNNTYTHSDFYHLVACTAMIFVLAIELFMLF
jgi:lipid-A-disaccharide synthase-like uncharacterized protein